MFNIRYIEKSAQVINIQLGIHKVNSSEKSE